MRELYGNSIRESAGFEEAIQQIVEHESNQLKKRKKIYYDKNKELIKQRIESTRKNIQNVAEETKKTLSTQSTCQIL